MSDPDISMTLATAGVCSRLGGLGVQIIVRTSKIICTYEFDGEEDPGLVLALIGISPQVVVEEMRKLTSEEGD